MSFIELLKVILLGIVEGITEWLPISSTGHLILVEQLIQLKQSEAFTNMFNVVIQFGSILAVVVIYFHKLNPFSPKKTNVEKENTWKMWFKVIIACVPAAVIGLVLDNFMSAWENWQVVSAMLILYGVAFIVVESLHKETKIESMDDMTYKTALLIGLFQVLSIVPGTSRSGATILGAMLIGCSRSVAAEFSFFLAIPVMFGVSLLKVLKYGLAMPMQDVIVLLTGMVVAYIVSMLAIKFLMNYIKKNDFKVFGYYRIVLGIIVFLYFGISALL